MPKPRTRALVKQAMRLHYSLEGPDWDEAAQKVGLSSTTLRQLQKQDNWRDICREALEEMRSESLLAGLGRLISSALTDKTSSGVSAARALVDMHRDTGLDPDHLSDGVDFGNFTKEEREFACRLLARLEHQNGSG